MKKYGIPTMACLLLLFLWLSAYPFRGALAWVAGLNFPLCFVLAAGMLEDKRAVAFAAVAGIAVGALTGSAAPPLVFVAAMFAAGYVKSAMFRPGSVFHIMAYWPIILSANFILYIGAATGELWGGPAWALVAVWSVADFALFLLMLAAFRDRRRAMTYRMRR